jgi:hypothetical protein
MAQCLKLLYGISSNKKNNKKMEQVNFLNEYFDYSKKIKEDAEKYDKSKIQINRDPKRLKFFEPTLSVNSDGSCEEIKFVPDQKAIKIILASSKKKQLKANAIIIARYEWLKRNKLKFPENMELPNLYLKIKNGKLVHVFYSNVLTHVIKKQNYFIQILN